MPKSPFVTNQYQRILAMIGEIGNDDGGERKFCYVFGQIKILEECMNEGDNKISLVKQLVSWALQEFNVSEFKSDIRMLYLWKLLGKYSVEYKMEGVLAKLNDLGFFKTKPEFYVTWAEYWASQNNIRKFYEIAEICTKNCKVTSDEIEALFRPIKDQYFPSTPAAENTQALLNVLGTNEVGQSQKTSRPSPAQYTHSQNVRSNEHSKPAPRQINANAPTTGHGSGQKEAQKAPRQVEPTDDTTNYQVNSRLYRNCMGLYADTLPMHSEPGGQSEANATKTIIIDSSPAPPKKSAPVVVPREDFSVFCDELTGQPKGQTQNVQTKQCPQNVKDSPFAKRQRKELSFTEDGLDVSNNNNKEGNASIRTDKEESPMERKYTSPQFLTDDITIAGGHGKHAPSLCTSTPQRSMAPGLNLFSPGCDFFADEQQNNDQVRLFAQNQPGESGPLQRRLSLANNKVDAIKAGNANDKNQAGLSSSEKAKTYGLKGSTNALIKQLPNLKIGGDDKENEGHNDSTGHRNVKESITGPINPWDDQERAKILKRGPIMLYCHEFMEQKCPRIELNRKAEFGGEEFQITKLLGEGGFAKVFKANYKEDNKTFAIKYEMPACPWEVYICASLKNRLAPQFLSYIMEIRDAYIFNNASAIIYDFYPLGTLLDFSNAYKRDGWEIGGLMVAYFGLQLGKILEQIKSAKIIHADVKPDNVMITIPYLPESPMDLEKLFSTPAIKLIDFGRAIDMTQYPKTTFCGRAGTKCFDCMEMISGKPWTYQTDYFGFVGTIHVLIFNEYMVTHRENNKFRPVKQIKRRMALRSMWLDMFDDFLNIKDCESLPDWKLTNNFMQDQLKTAIVAEPAEWKKAAERFNNYVKNVS
ncbi:protein kinase domain-containing protein [Ditylenchus destructor]|uniref:Protein kinase domain-containing protein n=1 Tax=Ditylenchus destructor TaxID=166010 RepID=A0AAD4MME7_9BILA|nr:protein kinase domain-containing protein [Ditylenchus destructor]